jgi:D-threo-aldose 1-dehydrogenase
MKRNRLGSSGVEVTEMGLGTAQLGDLYEELDQAAASAIVDAAWDCGVR